MADAYDNAGDKRTATIAHTVRAMGGSDYDGLVIDPVTVTVTDDDGPSVLSIGTPTVAEGDAGDTPTLRFPVSLAPASGKTVTVAYADTDTGTATSATDYTAVTSGTLTFDPGDTALHVDVTVTGDVLDEANETVILQLSSATNATLSGNAATLDGTGTITDDDAAELSIDNVAVAEGATATFTVSLSLLADRDVTVTATTADGTATSPGDYTHKTEDLTIDAGASSTTFAVVTRDDMLGELDETFNVELSAASVAIDDGTGVGTITGDGTTVIAIADATAVEGGTLSFTLTRTGDLSGESSVTWTTGDDTAEGASKATAPADYTAVSNAQTVTFAATVSTATISVTTAGDQLVEGSETLRINLASPVGAALARTYATGTITDDDAPSNLDLVISPAPPLQVNEGASASYSVKLANQPTSAVTVTITGHDNTGLTLDEASLEFTPSTWNDAQTVTVTAGQDDNASNEEVTLTHTAQGGGFDSVTTDLEVTITDDDMRQLMLSRSRLEIAEGQSGSYTVRLATEPSDPVTVSISGHAGTDLTVDTTTLKFTPSNWNEPQTVRVTAPAAPDDDQVRVQDANTQDPTMTLVHTAAGGDYEALEASLDVMVLTDLITISIAGAEGPEGSHLEFRVTLSRPSPGDIEVSWGSHPAEAGTKDFEFKSGRLHFEQGEQEKLLRVLAYEDDDNDPNETFYMDIWNPDGAVLRNGSRVWSEQHRFDMPTTTGHYIDRAIGLITGDAPPPLELRIEVTQASVPEGARFRVTVRADAPNGYNRAIRVPLDYSNGTHESGDIDGPSGLWIHAGERDGNTDIETYHDADADDETFTVSIGAVRPYEAVVGSPASVDLTVLDDGGSGNHRGTFLEIGVDADADSAGVQGIVLENGGAKEVRVTATLKPATAGDVPTRFTQDKTVSLSVGKASDTATEGVDYDAVSDFNIVIPARKDSGSATFTLTPTDDSLVELDETISVDGVLSGISVRQGSLRIRDDDSTQLSIDGVTVAEGDTASFTVTLSKPHTSVVTVTAATADDTAESPADYTRTTQTLTFAPGDTSVSFDVETHDDADIEGSESFEVRLSNASGAIIVEGTATATITEGTTGLSVFDAQAAEGESLTFTINREGMTSEASSVKWSTAPNNDGDHPASGADYDEVTSAQTVNFAAGDTRKTITVGTSDDAEDEPDETFMVVLSEPSGSGVLMHGTAIGTIVDNDDPPSNLGLVISESSLEIDEGDSATYTVKLQQRPSSTVTVTIAGHEDAGLTLSTASLEFAPSVWDDEQTVTVTAGQDDDTGDEAATLIHTAAEGDDSVSVEIEVSVNDDDTPALRLAPSRLEVIKGESASYTVRLATRPDGPVTVAIAGHADANLTLDAASLDFTPSDWNIGQRVTVSAAALTGTQDAAATLAHTASGANYGGVEASLDVTIFAERIRISIYDAEAPEGSNLEFRVTLSRPSNGNVSVSWGAIPGVAKAGRDFEEISGVLRFLEGEREKTIRVWAIKDDEDDPNETFTVDLWNPSGAVLDNPVTSVPMSETFDKMTRTSRPLIQATGTIIGPAPPPLELSIGAEHMYIEEGGSTQILVTATVPNELTRMIRVPVVYNNGTAENGDYEGDSGLWIPEGSRRGTLRLTVFQDDDSDDETLTVSIGQPRRLEAFAGSPSTVRLTILDDDGAAGDFDGLTITVENAEAVEGVDSLDFQIRLNRPAPGPVTVRAETKAGTATEGSDYNHWADEVRFAAGQRIRNVSVWVNDDDIDEGSETLTLELSNPEPAEVAIARAVATGTISNTDLIPGGWLARFGRTLAQQTVEVVADRLQARREPGFEGSVPMLGLGADSGAGNRANDEEGDLRQGGPGSALEPAPMTAGRMLSGTGSISGSGPAGGLGSAIGGSLPGGASSCGGPPSGSAPIGSPGMATPGRALPRTGTGAGPAASAGGGCGDGTTIGSFILQALSGASFTRTGETDPHGGTLSWWGRGEQSQFTGRDGALGLNGEIASGRLGVDYARGNWLAGVSLAHSFGKGDWSGGAGGGELEASLTSLAPYAALAVSDRLQMWSAIGAGSGILKIAHGKGDEWKEKLKTDLQWRMAAAGARGDLFGVGEDAGPELSLVADALWAATLSGSTEGLVASRSDVTRLRVGLEGSWAMELAGGGFTPTLELGVRHDGGDAETGFGVDVGGGIAWDDPKRGISLDIQGRTLITHEEDGARDWGVSASFAYAADPDSKRGLALKLGQELGGQASGGLAAMFTPGPPGERLGVSEGGRWTSELAYGFPAFREQFTLTPSVSYGVSDMAREYSLGWSLAPTKLGPDLSLNLLSTWRDSGLEPPDLGIRLEVMARW